MSTITTRSGKGSPLTNTEVDNNFTNLNTDKIEADSTNTLTNKTIDAMSNTVGANHLHYKVKATAALSKGAVVKITGYNSGEDAYEIDAVSSASDVAVGIVDSSLANGDFGLITNTGLFEGLDTSSFSVGDILYPNSSGGFTSTKPTTGTYQAAAFVLRSHAVNGAVMCEFSEPSDANLAAFSDAITLPTSDGTSGQALITDGAGNISFGDVDALPSQTGNNGKYLTTDGTDPSWADVDSLPDQTGNSGKYLTTDGTDASWGTVDLSSKQDVLSEGAFADGDKTKLDGIESGADVTDTANVTAAGALMDSEVTNLAQVKAFDSTDYATAAQGTLADSAVQDLSDLSITATAAEINKLDGVTATTAELNYTDGVTSNIQTQLDAKLAKSSNLSDLTSASTARTNLGLGSLATKSAVGAAEITDNTVGAAELNVTGNGTTSQYLRSDGDGTFTWATPPDTNTTYSVGDGGLTEKNFTSALNTKLSGIESGATADQTASEILTAIKTVDGSGSGLDADTLDGAQPSVSASNSTIVQRHSSGYIFANYFNTTPNDVSSGVTKICCETGNDGYIRHATAGAVRSFINVENGATADQTASEILTAIKTVDGSGSGLDADNVDGRTWSTTRNSANTLVTRDGSGYTQLGWINTTSGSTTSTINKIYASYDDYIRYVTPAELKSQLGVAETKANGCIYENAQTISSSYTMTTNYNGHSVGDITISTGVTVTIPTGSNWVVS